MEIKKYHEIRERLERVQYLLGRDVDGAVVEEIVPVPLAWEREFWECYAEALDAGVAFAALAERVGSLSGDAEFRLVAVCDKSKIDTDGFLPHVDVETLMNDESKMK